MSTQTCFNLTAVDGLARVGLVDTAHGSFETPAFMPVGTQGTVKGVNPEELKSLGAQIILSNTYHLHLRPGDEIISGLGGLHEFMGWRGPILTDSGGFQVYSLAGLRKVSRQGVTFRSHIDGRAVEFTPEKVIQIQNNLGVDILMVLDECLKYPATKEQAQKSLELTTHWAERSRQTPTLPGRLMFGIVQGGMFDDLRIQAAQHLVGLNFDGYAIGGLSVGESHEQMISMAKVCLDVLPQNKPRYLMGVGMPKDIVAAVSCGIDMFDCVIPTRSARFGRLFRGHGYINIRNSRFRNDPSPVDTDCDCLACRNFSRAYLSHLMHAGEILGMQLASIHNLRYYQRLVSGLREAIRARRLEEFARPYIEPTGHKTD